MTVSIAEQIIAAAVTALTGSGMPVGLTVHRFRTRPLSKDLLPAMAVFPIRDEQVDRVGQLEDAPLSERHLTFRVEIRVKGETPTVDQQLDPLITWAVQALNIDHTFGGLVEGLQQQEVTWAAAELDEVYGGAAVDFIAHYVVVAADPTHTQ